MKRPLVRIAAGIVTLALASSAHAGPHGGGHGPGGHGQGLHNPGSHRFYRPGGGHGGWHGGWRHPESRFFVGGSVFFDPFFFGPFYPYPYPYYVPYPGYAYPPPPDYGWSPPPSGALEPSDETEQRAERTPSTPDDDAARATYGLVQLRGIPDGASVDLDGRFWLTAENLDDRWLAVPRGEHTLSVRVRGSDIVERRIDVKEGKNHVVRFGPFRHETG